MRKRERELMLFVSALRSLHKHMSRTYSKCMTVYVVVVKIKQIAYEKEIGNRKHCMYCAK